MIQDIAPHRFDNAYFPYAPQADSRILYFENRTCLVKQEEGLICFPTFAEAEQAEIKPDGGYAYLFSIDEHRYYLVTDARICGLEGYRLETKELFRFANPQYEAFAAVTGLHLDYWYRSHTYCGRCGKKTVQDTKQRMLYCPECGNMEFPVICPAAIIAVTDGNRILLSKYAGRTYKRYALLAGYTEIGETMEETVQREVMEEVGLRVKNIRYYKSQPWGLTGTILMGFYCELDGADTIRLDEKELALAEWFEREQIPVEPLRDSLTNEMIIRFKENRI